ncbi:hypothetical protein HY993_04655 [Candidatus Micrarchaeota archaeon]|nr:hypothetical protein [Candidatus Micrarchaeota archaeon]
MDVDLPFGPWARLVNAQWGDYPIGLYTNKDKLLLLVMFERVDNKITGALLFLKKVFKVDGDFSRFAQNQKREIAFQSKTGSEGYSAFMFVSASPAYVKYSDREMSEALSKQVGEVNSVDGFIQDYARSNRIAAREFADLESDDQQLLLGDPFMLFSLAGSAQLHKSERKLLVECVIGAEKDGTLVKTRLDSLSFSAVTGGSIGERMAGAQVLAECALSNGVPVIFFDSSDSFSGLARANPDSSDFPAFKMFAMPLGYPYKEYSLGDGLYIDLNQVDADSFISSIGVEKSGVAQLIQAAFKEKGELNSLSDLEKKLSSIHETKQVPQFALNRAARVLSVVSKLFPALFSKNSSAEILVPWHEGIGKAYRVNLSKYSARLKNLFISSLLSSLPAAGGTLKALVVINEPVSSLSPQVISLLEKLPQSGVYAVVCADNFLDLKVFSGVSLALESVESDYVVSYHGEKGARFKLRPTFSACATQEFHGLPSAEKKPVSPAPPALAQSPMGQKQVEKKPVLSSGQSFPAFNFPHIDSPFSRPQEKPLVPELMAEKKPFLQPQSAIKPAVEKPKDQLNAGVQPMRPAALVPAPSKPPIRFPHFSLKPLGEKISSIERQIEDSLKGKPGQQAMVFKPQLGKAGGEASDGVVEKPLITAHPTSPHHHVGLNAPKVEKPKLIHHKHEEKKHSGKK